MTGRFGLLKSPEPSFNKWKLNSSMYSLIGNEGGITFWAKVVITHGSLSAQRLFWSLTEPALSIEYDQFDSINNI